MASEHPSEIHISVAVQAEHRESGALAALKRVPIQDETELEDFMVEIDILSECKHPNIVGLHEAFYFDHALWVRCGVMLSPRPSVTISHISLLSMFIYFIFWLPFPFSPIAINSSSLFPCPFFISYFSPTLSLSSPLLPRYS